MRKQLSMKRLHMLSANYCVSLGEKKGLETMPIMLDFMKYCWEHKEDDGLYSLPLPTKQSKE